MRSGTEWWSWVDRLAALGAGADAAVARVLGDGVFELRFVLGPRARRITYRFTRTDGSCC